MRPRWCHAAAGVISPGDRRPHQHQGGLHHAPFNTRQQSVSKHPDSDQQHDDSMKSLVVELGDGIANVLMLIAELAGISVDDQLRVAINNHVINKITSGELGPLAKKALDDIEAETLAGIEVIAAVFDLKMDDIDVSPRHGTPSPRMVKSEEPKRRQMGFAPPPRDESRVGNG